MEKGNQKSQRSIEIFHVQPHPQNQMCMWLKNIQPM